MITVLSETRDLAGRYAKEDEVDGIRRVECANGRVGWQVAAGGGRIFARKDDAKRAAERRLNYYGK